MKRKANNKRKRYDVLNFLHYRSFVLYFFLCTKFTGALIKYIMKKQSNGIYNQFDTAFKQ